MASLNKYAETIAYSIDKQFDYTFREVVKFNIEYYRELLLRREDFNTGLNTNDFVSKLVMPLEEIDEEGITRLITKKPVPYSVRLKGRGRTRYNFVGTKNGVKPFTQTTSFEYYFLQYVEYQDKVIYYLFTRDNKIKILNNFKLCEVRVDGVFANISSLQDICENIEDFSDDAEYPLSGDLFQAIKKGILSEEFPLMPKPDETIETDKDITNEIKQ